MSGPTSVCGVRRRPLLHPTLRARNLAKSRIIDPEPVRDIVGEIMASQAIWHSRNSPSISINRDGSIAVSYHYYYTLTFIKFHNFFFEKSKFILF